MSDYYQSTGPSTPQGVLPLGWRPVTTTGWCVAAAIVAVGIYSAARQGIRVAEERVPPASVGPSPIHAIGAFLTVTGTISSPLVLAWEQQELREYYFRESSIPGTGLEGIVDGSVFEHRGTLEVEVLESDLDLIRVRVVSGPRVGEAFWLESPDIESDLETIDGSNDDP